MELWYTEKHSENVGITLKATKTLFSGKSEFQQLDILETPEYGRMMLLDGLVMVTERDEFVYHDMIAHPALFTHPAPKNVLVIGGGDGGSIREIMKHPEVEQAVLCEIDGLVIEKAIRAPAVHGLRHRRQQSPGQAPCGRRARLYPRAPG